MLKKVSKTSILVICLILFLLITNTAFSNSIILNSYSIRDSLVKVDFIRQSKIGNLTQFSSQDLGAYLAQAEEEEDIFEDVYAFERKSTRKAFLYSFILPGAGEFYANSKIKAGLFLGLEALFWVGYFNYHGKGADKRDEYKEWADRYWDETRYKKAIEDYYGVNLDTLDRDDGTDSLPSSELDDALVLTHWLPGSKDQQYYEMIGKYDQFRYGWEDYNPYDKNYMSLLRSNYVEMRKHSNNLFDKAKYIMIASLANHVLSAFDAAITVRSYNKKGERFSNIKMRMKLARYEDEIVPFLTLKMKF